ncbi:hypothetical protein EHQ52_17055 [Leptospira koniambonensis]|uniref:Restriction endonuclease n=1 Tax=Leptospira koniambonensis TaxID=2484950 RepID=A0A4V3JN13_9LEPT|nr:hypothetical protein [Leptospira koniambonensis]TGL31635.1 hypothetical protein EHQ52_17055 [Leptospira koniambonensis]
MLDYDKIAALHALISLRASYETNPIEYRYATDLSPQELDKKIEEGLSAVDDSEVKANWLEFKSYSKETSNQPQKSFLLQILNDSSYRKAAYYGALGISQEHLTPEDLESVNINVTKEKDWHSDHSSIRSLAINEFYKQFSEYYDLTVDAIFPSKQGMRRIDAILEPKKGYSFLRRLVVEYKQNINSRNRLTSSLQELLNFNKPNVKISFSVLIYSGIQVGVDLVFNKINLKQNVKNTVYIIQYDYRNNTFDQSNLELLRKYILTSTEQNGA